MHSDIGDTIYKVLIGVGDPDALAAAENALPGSLGRWIICAHAAVDDIREAAATA